MKFKLVEKLTNSKIFQVYHGSPKKFDKFSLSYFGGHDVGQWGKGIYFTDNKDVAKNYAEDKYIYTSNIKFDNPLIVDASNPGWVADLIMDEGTKKSTEILKEKGYDGIIVEDDSLPIYNEDKSFDIVKANQYIIFDPTNIDIIRIDNLNKLSESLYTHSQLNPILFENDKIKEEVKNSLIKIADKFVEDLKEKGVPLKVYDYWVVGSNAAYNYQPDSDIDVHIIVDTSNINVDDSILRLLYDYAKASFNDKHTIFIKDHPVEVYLEDMNSSAVSNGVYSLQKDEWVKIPTPEEDKTIVIEDIPEYDGWYKNYNSIMYNPTKENIQEFIDNLYILRKESLAKDGEFGVGNLIFKEFRNQGILQELKDKLIELEDEELTLENMGE